MPDKTKLMREGKPVEGKLLPAPEAGRDRNVENVKEEMEK